jgi:hypothetical protein
MMSLLSKRKATIMNHPFDEFSKSLANESVPRRESLRRLGAALAGALIAPLVIGAEMASANPDDRAKRRRRHRRFRRPGGGTLRDACTAFCSKCSTKPKRNHCLSACRACCNDPRRLNGRCGNYVCCAAGTTYCSGYCVDLTNDVGNCGACRHACGEAENCIGGECRAVE